MTTMASFDTRKAIMGHDIDFRLLLYSRAHSTEQWLSALPSSDSHATTTTIQKELSAPGVHLEAVRLDKIGWPQYPVESREQADRPLAERPVLLRKRCGLHPTIRWPVVRQRLDEGGRLRSRTFDGNSAGRIGYPHFQAATGRARCFVARD